ncbi:expressed unknown protein [Seminavis robusta]|uniref:Uncharacterized protein n=1 Tax=Seminavis robusta TaxID=568900 RepID=A0A9N8H7V3_9STRA|nr:expressed unknown protein [Seminavis robusta]|eukprot:Sro151_g069160.1 n/a (294) ;mRNA; r:47155-48036
MATSESHPSSSTAIEVSLAASVPEAEGVSKVPESTHGMDSNNEETAPVTSGQIEALKDDSTTLDEKEDKTTGDSVCDDDDAKAVISEGKPIPSSAEGGNDDSPEEKKEDVSEGKSAAKLKEAPSAPNHGDEEDEMGEGGDDKHNDKDAEEGDNEEDDPSYEPGVDGMEEMTEDEEKSAMLNIVLSELLRKFREENGRGPSSVEVLEIRASVAEQLEMEVATHESIEAQQQKHEEENGGGKKRAAAAVDAAAENGDSEAQQPSSKRVKFHDSVVDEEEEDSKMPAQPKQQPTGS